MAPSYAYFNWINVLKTKRQICQISHALPNCGMCIKDMIQIERTCDWEGHIGAVSKFVCCFRSYKLCQKWQIVHPTNERVIWKNIQGHTKIILTVIMQYDGATNIGVVCGLIYSLSKFSCDLWNLKGAYDRPWHDLKHKAPVGL